MFHESLIYLDFRKNNRGVLNGKSVLKTKQTGTFHSRTRSESDVVRVLGDLHSGSELRTGINIQIGVPARRSH